MDILLSDCRERIQEATLNLLWQQWCTLGVAGNALPAPEDRLIDLDALVLATSSIGRLDPRLFDEALDWLAQYGCLVNLQRVKNLHKQVGLGNTRVLAAMADWLRTETGQPRWKLFVEGKSNGESEQVLALFAEQGALKARNPDPLFRKHGLERNLYTPRGMSRAPDPGHPANLMPILRALMGVSARVEILLYLGGSMTRSAHATDVAHATGYAPRTLQIQLKEMQLSGQVLGPPKSMDEDAPVRRGANRCYSLNDDVREFLSPRSHFPEWTPWASLFRISENVLENFPKLGKPVTASMVISSRLREVLHLEFKALLATDLWQQIGIHLDANGDKLLVDFCEGFHGLLEGLSCHSTLETTL